MRSLPLALLLSLFLLAPLAQAAETQWQDGAMRPRTSNAVVHHKKSVAAKLSVSDPLDIALGPLAHSKSSGNDEPEGALKIGTGRMLPQAYAGDLAPHLRWHNHLVPGQKSALVAFIRISSSGAKGIRAGLRFLAAPSVSLQFGDAGGLRSALPSFKAKVKRDEFGDVPVRWSPIANGDVLMIQIVAPTRSAADSVRLEIVRVSHIHGAKGDDGLTPKATPKSSSSCRVPIACGSAPENARHSTMNMNYARSNGNSYVCTGTLMNDSRADEEKFLRPYLYTANHCISTQAEAESLVLEAHFEHASCSSQALSPDYFAIYEGADLLATDAGVDQSLLRMKSYPTGKRISLSGWDARSREPGAEEVFGVHHPGGDPKEWAEGQTLRGLEVVEVKGHGPVTGARVVYGVGGIRPGSSGSGLFQNSANGGRVVGALSAGPDDDCTRAFYGWMNGFWPRMGPYMQNEPPAQPVDDHGNNRGGASTLSVNLRHAGELETVDDVDYFSFSIDGSGEVSIRSDGNLDTVGTLFDEDGRQLSYNDDGGEGLNFLIALELEPGTYYVRVAGFGGDVGPYGLTVGFEADPVHSRSIPLMLSAAEKIRTGRQGFMRIQNYADSSASLRITGIDDSGQKHGPIKYVMEPRTSIHFNSDDIEQGNVNKGLPDGLGDGDGWWRLQIKAAIPIFATAYIRTSDGFLTGMHEAAPSWVDDTGDHMTLVPIFNPASNYNQVSWLRITNQGQEPAKVAVGGLDDAAQPGDGVIRFVIKTSGSAYLSAEDIEEGIEFDDGTLSERLGDGKGKWQLLVVSDQPLRVASLMFTPTGHLSNLSSINLLEPSAFDLRRGTADDEREAFGAFPDSVSLGTGKALPRGAYLPPSLGQSLQ